MELNCYTIALIALAGAFKLLILRIEALRSRFGKSDVRWVEYRISRIRELFPSPA